jgi:hypothetical protein
VREIGRAGLAKGENNPVAACTPGYPFSGFRRGADKACILDPIASESREGTVSRPYAPRQKPGADTTMRTGQLHEPAMPNPPEHSDIDCRQVRSARLVGARVAEHRVLGVAMHDRCLDGKLDPQKTAPNIFSEDDCSGAIATRRRPPIKAASPVLCVRRPRVAGFRRAAPACADVVYGDGPL